MHRRPMISLLAFVLVALTSAVAFAADPAAERSSVISLRSQVIDVRQGDAAVPAHLRAAASPGDEGYFLVKFAGPVTAAEHARLEAVATTVHAYLPHDAYLVRLPVDGEGRALAGDLAAWVGPYHPAYKISPAIADVESFAAANDLAATPLIVMLQIYRDADLAAVRAALAELGVTPVGIGAGSFFSRARLLLPAAEIARLREALAAIPEVFWVDLEPRRVLLNDTTIWVGQSGLAGGMATPVFARGIFGEGQVIGIIDTGLDADMCYFRDQSQGLPPRNECNGGVNIDHSQRKVLAVDFLWQAECNGGIGNGDWDNQDHGTHVAGIAAGDNFANPLVHDPGDGMAPGAKLIIQDGGFQTDNCGDLPGIGCPVVDLVPIFQQAYDQGARIHTNSWGDQENAPITNNYTAASQDADEFMWNHPDFLLLFAAGNAGSSPGSVLSPSTAKSVVSVGSTLRGAEAESRSGFSSCGPTDDNRIKPEVMIPGSSIVSANSDNSVTSLNCNTRSLSGTSMSSPAAAGLAALVREYFMDGFYPSGAALPGDAFTPSAALVKAALVNSTRPMANVSAIPSTCQGWGRLLLDDTLHFAGDVRQLWVEDDDAGFPLGLAGANRVFTFTVDDDTEPFKVTLNWTDFPSTPAAGSHLVNDLDLTVSGPSGTFLGNVFSGGVSTTGGSADRLNTLEQVLLSHPVPGVYTVTVTAANVPQGPQPFALVVSGEMTVGDPAIFADGFESGGLGAWSQVVP